MKNVNFTDEDKIKYFDKISALFYDGNFGSTNKSDIECCMFHIYLDKIISENLNKDGTIDYNKCSDFKISKELCITEQKVRELKKKSQLKYPIENNWRKSLVKLIENARYEEDTKKIYLNIPDPNLYSEIQNFIEEQGAYIEMQYNRKILKLRVEYFIMLITSIDGVDEKELIKKLKNNFKETNSEIIDSKDYLGIIAKYCTNAQSIVNFLSIINAPGTDLLKAFIGLVEKWSKL